VPAAALLIGLQTELVADWSSLTVKAGQTYRVVTQTLQNGADTLIEWTQEEQVWE
jgi:hypothetical protein